MERIEQGQDRQTTPTRVAPPPMLVIHRGWFRTTVTERQAADLAREDRARDERERRSA